MFAVFIKDKTRFLQVKTKVNNEKRPFATASLTLMMMLMIVLPVCCSTEDRTDKKISSTKQKIMEDFLHRHADERVIIIDKIDMKLYHYENKDLTRNYPVPIAMGFDPVQDKEKRGDGRTPEGEYFIYAKHPSRSFSFFLEISYPNSKDIERGLRDGLITQAEAGRIRSGLESLDGGIRSTALGDAIGIHTSGSRVEGYSVTSRNWTLGCIALEYDDMERLYNKTHLRDKVLIIGESYVERHLQRDD